MSNSKTNQSSLAVIKVGGDVLLDAEELNGLTGNVAELIGMGWRVLLLHGGGPQVNRLQEKHGLTPNKVGGRRITSPEDLLVVKQAIAGEVNVNLVSALIKAGVNAFGCHGASGKLIEAEKRPPVVVSGAGSEPVDFGEVGDVVSINRELLQGLLDLQLVPVIATLGVNGEGRIFNINADTTVVRIAAALQADLLLMTTAVGAVYRDLKDANSRISEVNCAQARTLIEEGVIVGGMIPKVEEAMSVLEQGVAAIAIVSGRQPGAFKAAAEGNGKFGTRIVQ